MTGKPAIGFIGLGPMGHGMASCLLKAGHPLHIRGNRNRAPVEDLVGQGAVEAASPRAMAKACGIVHLCLPNSAQVEAVVRGEDGLIAAGREGLVVIDTTTADPVSTVALAAELEAAGMHMVDAPLGRTPKEAAAGKLDAMVGADAEVFVRVKPVIECWAGNIQHLGPVGSGHRMKLIMNFIGMGYAALYAEAVVLGAKNGISPQTVNEVIGASRLTNGFFETFMKYTVGRDRDAHRFSIANASKDVRYVASMAAASGTVNVMGAAVKHYFTHAEAVGHGDDFVPMLADFVGRLNGIEMEEEVEKGTRDA